MSGVLVFNGHTHATDEVGIKIDSDIIESKFKEPLIRIERWTIVGALKNDGASGGLQAGINALNAAYQDGGQNYGNVTYTANGNVHTLSNSGSFSGVRVKSFGYMGGPWKMHTEMSNRRAFYAVLQAEYLLSADIVGYQEEVEQFGQFGSRFRYMPSLTGTPEYQTLNANTTATYIQRGTLIKRSSAPSANAIIFGSSFVHNERVRVKDIAPEILATNNSSQVGLFYGVQWYYEAEYASAPTLTYFDIPSL